MQPQLEPMVFDDLAPVEVEVKYKGKSYLLVEVDTPSAAKFKSAAAANFTYNDGSMTGLRAVGDLDPLLVSLCLKEVYDTDKRRPVSLAFVNTMDAKVVKALAERAKEINPALDEKPTKDSLDKQITRLTSLRDKLFPQNTNGQCVEDDAKN